MDEDLKKQLEQHSAGATVRHQSTFEELLSHQNTFELDKDFLDK